MHGAALAGCLQLMNNTFNEGRIPGTHSYEALLLPWGSNPLTDPLLSTESMSIIYDCLTHNRNDKARDISAWTAARIIFAPVIKVVIHPLTVANVLSVLAPHSPLLPRVSRHLMY